MRPIQLNARISEDLDKLVTDYANEHNWTRSFALVQILKQFFKYELTGEC